MSGLSTHGVGAAACAKADVASADSAAAIKRVLVENPIIIILPGGRSLRVFVGPPVVEQTTNAVLPSIRRVHSPQRVTLDSSLRDVKQDDSNNEVAPSRSGEQIDDVLDGVVGAVVGGFESAVWAMLRVRTAVEAAVGKWSAQLFVEEQK